MFSNAGKEGKTIYIVYSPFQMMQTQNTSQNSNVIKVASQHTGLMIIFCDILMPFPLKLPCIKDAILFHHQIFRVLSREGGRSLLKPTISMHTPLIHLKQSDPTTMITAMVEGQRLTEETGQKYTVFTGNQQLYKVLCDIKWVYPERFENFVPRLGGMHVGVHMQNT